MRKTLKFVAAMGLFLSATGCVNNEQKKSDDVEMPSTTKCESVDLGLTSGTKWATCNVGADSPEKYGEYFAWGETQSKDVYSDTTYAYYVVADTVPADSSVKKVWKFIGTDIAGTEYDVATAVMGKEWMMPSDSQCRELLSECDWAWTVLNGVNGYKVTGKNGNSIFFPASGVKGASDVLNNDKIGGFWSSTLFDSADTVGEYAMSVYFYSESHTADKGGRWIGRTIRAVAK